MINCSEKEISDKLENVLNQNYKLYSIRKLTFPTLRINEPIVKVRGKIFCISDSAKEQFSTLYNNEFFEAYNDKYQKFVSKQLIIEITNNSGEMYTYTKGRIYLYVMGQMTYSIYDIELLDEDSWVPLSEFTGGFMTKAAR